MGLRLIRGGLGGLLFGVGLATMLVMYGVIAFGTKAPFVFVLAGIAVGLALAALLRPSARAR